jgi:hypothetical protein
LTPRCYEFRSCFYGRRNSGSGVAVVAGTMMVAHFGTKGRPRAVGQVGLAGQTFCPGAPGHIHLIEREDFGRTRRLGPCTVSIHRVGSHCFTRDLTRRKGDPVVGTPGAGRDTFAEGVAVRSGSKLRSGHFCLRGPAGPGRDSNEWDGIQVRSGSQSQVHLNNSEGVRP